MKLILFGNPALEMDNLAILVGKELAKKGEEVLHVENPLQLADLKLEEYVILDVAEGIREPMIIESVDKLILGRLCSLHDFDMAYFLKLLKELGKIDKIRIIALPQRMRLEEALTGVSALLANL